MQNKEHKVTQPTVARKLRVLLVDDDREIARGASIRLRAAGYDVRTAYDGEQGLTAVLADHPDAIVADLRMPCMDGLTMLNELRNRPEGRSIAVVVLSASIQEDTRRRIHEMGLRHIVEKPYRPDELIRAVEAALHDVKTEASPGETQ